MLSQEAIKEYKQIYKKVYKHELSDSEALEQGTNLVELFKVLMKDSKNYEKRR